MRNWKSYLTGTHTLFGLLALIAVGTSLAGGDMPKLAFLMQQEGYEGDEAAEPADDGYDGDQYYDLEKQRRKVLEEIPKNADVLINVGMELMPSTPELTALGRKATKALVKGLLDNASDPVRFLCVSVLAGIRDPESAPALLEALKDRYASVRATAADGLGQMADVKYGDALWKLIQDPEEDRYVKSAAVEAMGAIGYSKAVPKMLEILRSDTDNGLAPAVISALWRMRNKADRDDLVDAFLFVLKSNRWGAERVIEYLGELKADDAVGTLATYFVGKQDFVKNRIILAMGKIGGAKSREFLKNVLGNTQVARHLNNAAIALAQQGDRDIAINMLVKLLGDRKAYLRINAAFALGEIAGNDPVAVQALAKALSDQNDLVRSEAAVALGRIKGALASAELEKLAGSKNPYVKLDAVIALNRIDYAKYKKLIVERLLTEDPYRHSRVVERGIRFMAEQKDPEALPYLLQYLRSSRDVAGTLALLQAYPQEQVKGFDSALAYLTHRSDGGSFAALLRVLRSWDRNDYAQSLLERLYHANYWTDERELIYYALGKMNAKEVLPALMKFNEYRDSTKLYQQFALANLGDEKSLLSLLDTLQNGMLDKQRDAAFLLGSLDTDAAVPRLREIMAKNADPFTAVAAAYALAGRGDTAAISYLYDVVKKGTPVVVDEASRALLVTQNPQVDVVLKDRVAKETDLVTKRRLEETLYQRQPKEFR